MIYLDLDTLDMLYKESLGHRHSFITLEVIAERHDDAEIEALKRQICYANVLGGKIFQRHKDPGIIVFDVRRRNNDPRSPKGSKYIFKVDREKLRGFIDTLTELA